MIVKFICVLAICVIPLTGCDDLFGYKSDDGTGTGSTLPGNPIPVVNENDGALIPQPRDEVWWRDRHEAIISGVVPNQKIVFVGDCFIQFLETTGQQSWSNLSNQYNGRISNLGFDGDHTGNIIWRLENGQFPRGMNPEYVVVLAGSHLDEFTRTPQSIAAGIGRIVQIINERAPQAKILLMSLPPRGYGIHDSNTVRNNNVNNIISTYNGFLGIQYVDFAHVLLDDQGFFTEEDCFLPDLVHLSVKGYELWAQELLKYIP